MSGTPTTAAHRPPRAIESFSKKRRRLRTSGVSTPAKEWSVTFSFITNFGDLSSEGYDEAPKTDNEGNRGSDQAPNKKHDAKRQTSGHVGGPRHMFRLQRLPLQTRKV